MDLHTVYTPEMQDPRLHHVSHLLNTSLPFLAPKNFPVAGPTPGSLSIKEEPPETTHINNRNRTTVQPHGSHVAIPILRPITTKSTTVKPQHHAPLQQQHASKSHEE